MNKVLLQLLNVLTMIFAFIFIMVCVATAVFIYISIILTGNYSVSLDFNSIGEGPVEMFFFVVFFSCFLIRIPTIWRSSFSRLDFLFKP